MSRKRRGKRKKNEKWLEDVISSQNHDEENGFQFPIHLLASDTTKSDIDKWKSEVLVKIKKEVKELEEILITYNPYDVIANISFSQLAIDPNTYSEVEHSGLAVIVEYVVLLYLKHPFISIETKLIDEELIIDIEERVRNIIFATNLYYASETFDKDLDTSQKEITRLRASTLSDQLFVRGPGYPHHYEETLSSIFSPLENELTDLLGFNVEQVLCVDRGFRDLVSRKLSDLQAAVVERENELKELINQIHSIQLKSYNEDNSINPLQVELASLSNEDFETIFWNMMVASTFSSLGNTVSLTVEEIANSTNLSVEQVQLILNYFSANFESVPSDFCLFSPTNIIKSYPLLHHQGRYLYPNPRAVLWAVKDRIEHDFKERKTIWKKYQRIRAEFLENEVLRFFSVALPDAECFRNLHYLMVDDNYEGKFELDGMIVFDTTVFLIEAKSGSLTNPSKRGSPLRLKKELKGIIGDAHSQAIRAEEHIRSGNGEFFTAGNKPVKINSKKISRIILVTVSLEFLDIYHANLHEVINTGIFESENLPWAVSIDILRVICEHIEFPTQLIHYLTRRQRLNEIGIVSAHDELDHFGNYLMSGLYFEEEAKEEKQFINLLSHTTPFDDYYFYEMGLRNGTVEKLKQNIPQQYREIVLEIEKNFQEYGFSEAIIILLDWSSDSKDEFLSLFKQIRQKAQQDSQHHDFSLLSNESETGITCFATTLKDANDQYAELGNFVSYKRNQQHATRWLGLLSIVDAKGFVHGFIVETYQGFYTGIFPWE